MSASVDQAFARFVANGDPAALAEVYDAVAPEFLRVALHLTRDASEAEDALQATFLAAIQGVRSYQRGRPVLPWLNGILVNQVRNGRRKEARFDRGRLAEERPSPESPEEEASLTELVEHLRARLDSIPEAFRAVLVLRLEHQLTASEIAHALGRPAGTVRSQLARGTELLRRGLPAGLAGAAMTLLTPPVRGLSAVRVAVLAEANLALSAGVGASLVAGGLLMKKLFAAAALALVVASAWWLSNTTTPARPEASVPATPAAVQLRAPQADQPEPVDAARQGLAAEPTLAATGAEVIAEAPSVGAIQVLARDAEGEPAAGALVVLQVGGAGVFRRPVRTVFTDAQGSARLEDLPPGHHPIRLLRGASDQVRVEAGETARVELELVEGYVANVLVLDEHDEPVPAAEIWLSERSLPQIGHVIGRADGQGRFRLEHLDDYHYVGARAPGRAHSFVRNLRGTLGAEYPLVIRLEDEGARVEGTVRGPDGSAVANALVSLHDLEAPSHVVIESGLTMPGPPPARAVSAQDGTFVLHSSHVGAVHVRAQAEGLAAYESPFTVLAGGRNTLLVDLSHEARIVGIVRDEQGETVTSARVHTIDREGELGSTCYSGVDGSFVLQGLASGPVQVEAIHGAHGQARATLNLVAGLDSDWSPRLVEVPRIAGRVLDPDGMPLAHWAVTVMDDVVGRAGAVTATTDADGAFAVTGLEARPHSLWINQPGHWREFPRHVETDVWPSPQELVVRIVDDEHERGRIEAQVVAPDGGAPKGGVTVTMWHLEERMWRSFPVDPETGELRVPSIPSGTVQVSVRPDGNPWINLGEHAVEAGRLTDLGRIQLEQGGLLEGSLSAGDERALESLRFLLSRPDRRAAGSVHRSQREFRSSSLAPGSYRLDVRGHGVESQRHDFDVLAGATVRLEITLVPAPTRELIIAPPAGMEAPPRHIWASATDGGLRQAWLDPAIALQKDGVYRTRISAAAGSYELVAASQSGLEGRMQVVMPPEGGQPIRLTLASKR